MTTDYEVPHRTPDTHSLTIQLVQQNAVSSWASRGDSPPPTFFFDDDYPEGPRGWLYTFCCGDEVFFFALLMDDKPKTLASQRGEIILKGFG